jgi:predicted transposase/invertase (TIGR01784 family)
MRHPTLMNDIIFKIVFGTQENEAVLRALLNAILGLSGPDRIVELTILAPHVDKTYIVDRGAILDVKARDGQGRLYNIELQVSDEPSYVKRALYYLARLYSEQLERGDPYDQLTRTIGISLLDYTLFADLADLHSTYRFYDPAHQRELSDILEIHFIELTKFRQDKPHALRTPFEKWLYVLKFGELYESGLEILPESLQEEEGIPMALDAMRRAYATDEVRDMIEFREKALHDEATRIARALRESRQEGIEQGSVQGRRENALAIARNLLADGMDRDKVLMMTGLRPEDLPTSLA